MTQTLLNRLVGLRWSQLAAPILPGVTCTAILVPALIAVEVILRAVLGTPSIYVVLGAKAATALVIFLSFVVSVRIAGMSDVVSEILTDLAPLLHGPYVRVHRKLRGARTGSGRTKGRCLREASSWQIRSSASSRRGSCQPSNTASASSPSPGVNCRSRAVRSSDYPGVLVLEYAAGWHSTIPHLSGGTRPTVAVVTAIGPSHLERFGSEQLKVWQQ